jgi:hypothetical protein
MRDLARMVIGGLPRGIGIKWGVIIAKLGSCRPVSAHAGAQAPAVKVFGSTLFFENILFLNPHMWSLLLVTVLLT